MKPENNMSQEPKFDSNEFCGLLLGIQKDCFDWEGPMGRLFQAVREEDRIAHAKQMVELLEAKVALLRDLTFMGQGPDS